MSAHCWFTRSSYAAACHVFRRMVNLIYMELSRRKLFTLGAASATVATAGLVAAPGAHAAELAEQPGEQPLGSATAADRAAQEENPENGLGCPLGKGL